MLFETIYVTSGFVPIITVFSLQYSTISDACAVISQASFIDLYKKGHIYNAEQPVIWDRVSKTAIAQSEVESKQQESLMYKIAVSLLDWGPDQKNIFYIATTRPEFMPACVAILYNPEDKRYLHLKNKKITLPIFDIIVPLIADEEVDKDKGTGLVMCCTFGDFLDVTWQKKT